MTLPLAAYRLATRAAQPLLARHLARRARAGKESPAHLHERRGQTRHIVPGDLIWLHGASLGETTALKPLTTRLLADTSANLLITCQTLSAHTRLLARYADIPRVEVAFAPLDTPAFARTFLENWKPRAAIFAESEIWPNLLGELAARNIPAALVNARLNDASLSRWARYPRTARKVFATFNPILAADMATLENLEEILERDIALTQNLKFAAVPDAPDTAALAALRARLGERPAWCALSIHAEETDVLRAFAATVIETAQSPAKSRPVMVVVPRYPGSLDQLADDDTIVLPGFGTTSLACAVSRFALVGGSLNPSLKGHNPLEPMHLGLPVATGLHTTSFSPVMAGYFAALDIPQADSLTHAATWLTDPESLARDTAAAKAFAKSNADVIDAVMAHLQPILNAR